MYKTLLLKEHFLGTYSTPVCSHTWPRCEVGSCDSFLIMEDGMGRVRVGEGGDLLKDAQAVAR